VFAAVWILAAYLLLPTDVPDDLRLREPVPSTYMSDSELDEARGFERFLRINGLLSLAVLIAVLVLYAARGERLTRESAAGRVGTGMLLAMLGFAIVWISQLPFGIAALWWERRHDVSEVGYLEWAFESFFALGAVFGFVCVAIGIVMGLAGPLRNRWWIAGAPVFVALGLLFAFLTPYLIPDQRPLRDQKLATEAKRLARAQGVEEIPVRVEEVKEFTDAPNAEAAGLGPSRRVILWDTLFETPFSQKEVRFILAHEFAHHSRDHLWKGFGWYALFAIPMAFVIAAATKRRGGMYEARAVPIALLVTIVLQVAITPLENVISRRFEKEADWIALETTRDPEAGRETFVELGETSLTDPRPPTWAYILEGTHPTISQRIAMADAWASRNGRRRR